MKKVSVFNDAPTYRIWESNHKVGTYLVDRGFQVADFPSHTTQEKDNWVKFLQRHKITDVYHLVTPVLSNFIGCRSPLLKDETFRNIVMAPDWDFAFKGDGGKYYVAWVLDDHHYDFHKGRGEFNPKFLGTYRKERYTAKVVEEVSKSDSFSSSSDQGDNPYRIVVWSVEKDAIDKKSEKVFQSGEVC